VSALVDATPEMGEWSVYVGDDSAHLAGTGYYEHVLGGSAPPRHVPRVLWELDLPFRTVADATAPDIGLAVAFAIPVEDAHQILAALNHIFDHPAYQAHIRAHPPGLRIWRAETQMGFIRFYGPVIAAGSRAPWDIHDAVELHHHSLADLRRALLAARARRSH